MLLPPQTDLDPEVDLETTCALLGVEVEDVIAELDYRQRQKELQMREQMRLAAKAGGERRILRDRGDGGGEVTMMVAPLSYHYWGRRLSYECWDDPQFNREYLRDNPEARVRSISDRTMIVKPEASPSAKCQGPSNKTARQGPRGRRGRWAL